MPKLALRLSYLGCAYHGCQRQKNALSIQQVLEDAIEDLTGHKTVLSGYGRTDAGVHARTYIASCTLDTSIPLVRLPGALNARLPRDVVVHSAHAVPDAFDARLSCICKEYTYDIHNAQTRDPFLINRAWFYPQSLDVSAMQRAAAHFVGKQDFAAVKSEGSPVRSTVRTIHYCQVSQSGALVSVRVCADGFLYNMVRAITGTLVYCGIGKLSPDDIPAILQSGDRTQAGPTAPPDGLYLSKLQYGMEDLDVC